MWWLTQLERLALTFCGIGPPLAFGMSFDLLAPHYRWMEAVLAGRKLQRCRTAFLPRVTGSKEALVLGEGTGRFVTALVKEQPDVRLTCIDSSAGMLKQVRKALQKAGADNAELIHANILDWEPPREKFDLIASHFFLDCFPPEELKRIIQKISSAAKPEAFWLISDFSVPSAGLAKIRARAILRLMYVFFRLFTQLEATTLVSPDKYLKANNFILQERMIIEWGLLHSDLWRNTFSEGRF
jgi:ubiquinone/menaquinone biosynthesis C-methylase UbiE